MKKTRNLFICVVIACFTALLFQASIYAANGKSFAIGNKKYDSLQDAFNNVKSGQTIKVLNNYELIGPTMNRKVNFTLDLNGKTLTLFRFGTIQVAGNCNMTIKGKGAIKKENPSGRIIVVENGASLTINSPATFVGSIFNRGKLTIKKGTFKNIKTNRVGLLSNRDNGQLIISGGSFTNASVYAGENGGVIENRDQGKVKITGGTFRHTGALDSHASDVYDPHKEGGCIIGSDTSSKGSITISGGTFQSTCNILRCNNSTLTISNGKFFVDGAGVLWLDGNAKATLTGGTYSAKKSNELCTILAKSKLTVKGGTFNSEWSVFENWSRDAVLTISAGTFITTMNEKNAMVRNADGKTSITGGSFTGKNCYGYFTEEGGTVKVGKNVKWDVKEVELKQID